MADKTVWVCPRCSASVTLYVTPLEPPTCANHKGKHVIQMQAKQNKNK